MNRETALKLLRELNMAIPWGNNDMDIDEDDFFEVLKKYINIEDD